MTTPARAVLAAFLALLLAWIPAATAAEAPTLAPVEDIADESELVATPAARSGVSAAPLRRHRPSAGHPCDPAVAPPGRVPAEPIAHSVRTHVLFCVWRE